MAMNYAGRNQKFQTWLRLGIGLELEDMQALISSTVGIVYIATK